MKAAFVLAAATLGQIALAAPPFSGPALVGRLTAENLKEASGLAVSRRDANFLWAVNDSGNKPILYLMGTDGSHRGQAEVDGHNNRDWEDLASFSIHGRPYLLIADTGDNLAFHNTCTLVIVEEPPPPTGNSELRVVLPVQWSIRFKYEDGSRDCEAVGVDAKAGKVLLVTKREPVPRLYELPLKPESTAILVARYLGPVAVAANRRNAVDSRNPATFSNQPTAMDIATDGSMAVLATYRSTMVYPRRPGQTWSEAFQQIPALLNPHGLGGCEDVALSPDGTRIYVTSEGVGSPIKRYDRISGTGN